MKTFFVPVFIMLSIVAVMTSVSCEASGLRIIITDSSIVEPGRGGGINFIFRTENINPVPVDARFNWWGHSSGPGPDPDSGKAALDAVTGIEARGRGSAISGDVDKARVRFYPWFDNPERIQEGVKR